MNALETYTSKKLKETFPNAKEERIQKALERIFTEQYINNFVQMDIIVKRKIRQRAIIAATQQEAYFGIEALDESKR